MRYFISIDVPDEDVKKNIVTFMDRISGYGSMNMVSPENLHMTLLFLGERDDSELDELRYLFTRTCEGIEVGEFTCKIESVGVFPHMNYIKTIFLGAEPVEELSKLHMKFSEYMDGENEHDFVPHVTIGRLKGIGPEEKQELREVLEETEREFGRFQVKNVRLKQSELGEDGPTYRDVEVHEL